MRDETCLRRQWALLRALSARRLGMTLREMAAEAGVTDRTIRRDLAVFQDVGFRVVEAVGDSGRKLWRIEGSGGFPALAFSLDEAVALHLGLGLLGPLAATPFGAAAREAARKVRAGFGSQAASYVERLGAIFREAGVTGRDYGSKSELIDLLMVAVEDHKFARVRYRSEGADAASDRDVRPLGIAYFRGRGALYLVARDRRCGTLKHYKIDRVEAVEVGDAAGADDDDFDLESHLGDAFGVYRRDGPPTCVRVRFGPAASRYVREGRWHSSQRLTTLPGGGLLAEFRVSGTEEIKRWLLGFGSKAVVLEPESLRREVVEELREVLASYDATPEAADPPAETVPPTRRPSRGRGPAKSPAMKEP